MSSDATVDWLAVSQRLMNAWTPSDVYIAEAAELVLGPMLAEKDAEIEELRRDVEWVLLMLSPRSPQPTHEEVRAARLADEGSDQ